MFGPVNVIVYLDEVPQQNVFAASSALGFVKYCKGHEPDGTPILEIRRGCVDIEIVTNLRAVIEEVKNDKASSN